MFGQYLLRTEELSPALHRWIYDLRSRFRRQTSHCAALMNGPRPHTSIRVVALLSQDGMISDAAVYSYSGARALRLVTDAGPPASRWRNQSIGPAVSDAERCVLATVMNLRLCPTQLETEMVVSLGEVEPSQ